MYIMESPIYDDKFLLTPVFLQNMTFLTDCKIDTLQTKLNDFGLGGLNLRGDLDGQIETLLASSAIIPNMHYVSEMNSVCNCTGASTSKCKCIKLFFAKNNKKHPNDIDRDEARTIEYAIFTPITGPRSLSTMGYYNTIQSYSGLDGREYIIKIHKKPTSEHPRLMSPVASFKENLKHIILNIILKSCSVDVKIKIIPDVYYFGISTDGETIYTVMEKGDVTLGEYFRTLGSNYNRMTLTMFSIFRSLEILNQSGLKFQHNDLKENNIIISNTGKPLLIDFGSTYFTVDGVVFTPYIPEDEKNYTNDKINITHDMMQLCSSLEPILEENIFKLFEFKKNSGTYILDSSVMKLFMTNYMRGTSYYIPYDKFYGHMPRHVNLTRDGPLYYGDVRLFIDSTELADNLGLLNTTDTELFDYYRVKYLKYKTKYLKLLKMIKNTRQNI